MAQFVNRVLDLTDRLFGFVGGERHDSKYDLRTPIVRIHDIGREVQLSTFKGKFGGLTSNVSPYFTINHDLVHAAPSTFRGALGIYANQSPSWSLATWDRPDPTKETVWILGVHALCSTSNFTEAYFVNRLDPKAGAGSGTAPNALIFHGTGVPGDSMTTGEFPVIPNPIGAMFPMPVSNKLLNNQPIEMVSISSGAMTIDWFIQCIRLPNGVLPPGLF